MNLTVPPAQVAALLDALDHLHATTSGTDRPGYEGMIAALQQSAGEPVELTARPALLREAILVAIDEAGERVSELSTDMLREGQPQTGELRARASVLIALLDLLDTVEAGS